VENAMKYGEIGRGHSSSHLAWLLFSIFQAENRRWLGLDDRKLEEGLSHLWTSVGLLLSGLSSKPAATLRAPTAVLRKLIR